MNYTKIVRKRCVAVYFINLPSNNIPILNLPFFDINISLVANIQKNKTNYDTYLLIPFEVPNIIGVIFN